MSTENTGLTFEQMPAALSELINEFREFKRLVVAGGIPTPELPKESGSVNYITRKEVAQKLHLSLNTLDTYTREGRLKSYRIGTRILYKSDDIQLFVRAVVPAPPERN